MKSGTEAVKRNREKGESYCGWKTRNSTECRVWREIKEEENE
jgi:hypothetical protein